MNYVLIIAKWLLIIEMVIVVIFVIFAYLLKLYFVLNGKHRNKQIIQFRKILQYSLENQKKLSHRNIKLFRKSVSNILILVNEFNLEYKDTEYWPELRQQVINEILRFKARHFAKSRNNFKKYLASRSFYFGIEKRDEPLIDNLLIDPILLVSLNASRVAFKYPSSKLINTIIDICSKGRRLQQSTFAFVIAEGLESFKKLITIIEERLNREEDPYVKTFCYHLLTQLPSHENAFSLAERDLESDNLELKLSVLDYLAHLNQKLAVTLISHCIDNKYWQVRVRAINLLGKLKDKASAQAIGEKLKDPQWWVRLRAAQALGELGDVGINILKSQSPEVDRYAYEAAQQVLISLQKAKEMRQLK
jgi:hypothetical protein